MTEVRARDLPSGIVDHTKIMYGDIDISSICVAADQRAGWADVIIHTQENEVLRDFRENSLQPLIVRVTGPIRVIYYGNNNHR